MVVYQPEGHGAARWAAGGRMLGVKIDRGAVDDALSDALGRQVTSQVDFAPVTPIKPASTRSWINMLLMFKEQFSGPTA